MNSKPTERDSSIQNGGGSATSNDAAQSQPAPFSGQTVSRKTFASKNLNAHALTKAPVNNAPRAATRYGAGGRLLVLTGNKAPNGPAAASAPTSSAALRGTNSAQDDGASAGTGTPSWGAAKDILSTQQPAGGSPSLAPASAKAKTPWSSGSDAAPAGASVGVATLKSSEFPDLGRENEPRPPPLQLRPGGSSGVRGSGSLAGCDSQAQHPPNGVTVGSSSGSSPGSTYDTAATAVLSPPIAPAAAPARSSSSGSGTVVDESARAPAAWGRASQQSAAPTAGGTSPPGERWTRGSTPVARGFSDRSGGGGIGNWRQQRGGGDSWSAQDGREQQHYDGFGRSWPDVPRRAVERRASGEGAADFGSSAQRPRQGSYEAGRPGWRERSGSNADARPPVRGFNAVGGGGGADASRNWREGGRRASIDETVSGAATQRRDSPHSTPTSPQLNPVPSPQAIAGEAQRTAEREAALTARDGDEVATAAALRARHELERLRAEREQQQQQCATAAPQRASYSMSVAADPYSVVTEPVAEHAVTAGASSPPQQQTAHRAPQQQAAVPSPLAQPWRAPAGAPAPLSLKQVQQEQQAQRLQQQQQQFERRAAFVQQQQQPVQPKPGAPSQLRSGGFGVEPRRPPDMQQRAAAASPSDPATAVSATQPAHPAQQRTEPQPLGWHPSPPQQQQQPQVRALLARAAGDVAPRLAADGPQKGPAVSSSDPFAAQPRGAGRLYDPKTGLVAAVSIQAAPAARAPRVQPQTRAAGSPRNPLTSSAATGEASAAGSAEARSPAGAPAAETPAVAATQQLQQQNADAAAPKQRREQAAAAAAQKQEDRAQRRREQRAARAPRTSGALYCRDAAGTVLSADGAGDPHLGAWRRLAPAATPAALRRDEGNGTMTAAAGAAAVQVGAATAAQGGARAVESAAATQRETNKERRQRKQLGVALGADSDVAVAAVRAAAADAQPLPQAGGVGAGPKQTDGAPCELTEAAEQSEAEAQAAEAKKLERKEKRVALAAQRVERWTLQREAKRAAKAAAAASQAADCEPAAAAAADVAGDGAQPLGAASAAAAAEEPADGAASSDAAAAAQPSLRWHGSRLLEELPPDAAADVACIQFGTLLAGSDAAADAADDAEHAPAELALQSAAEHEGVRTVEDADGARHSSAGVGDAHSPASHAAGVPDGVAVIPVAAAAAEPQSSGAGAGSAAAALAQHRTTAAWEGAEQAAAAVSSNVAAMPPQPAVCAVCAPPQAAPAFTSMSASFPMHVAYHGSSGEPVAVLDGSWVWSTAVAAGACVGGGGEHYGVAPLQQYAQPVWYDSGDGVVRSTAAAAAYPPAADDGWVTTSADGVAPPQHALASQQQQQFQQQGDVGGPAAAAESQMREALPAPTAAVSEGCVEGSSSSCGAAAQLTGIGTPPLAVAQEDEAAAPGAPDAVRGGDMAQPADKDPPSERARRPRGGKKHTAKMNNKANSGKAPADGNKVTRAPPASAAAPAAAAAAATIAAAAAASNSAAVTAAAANSTAAAAAAPDAAAPADAAAPSDRAAALWTASKPQKGKKGTPAAAAAAVAAQSPRSGTDGSACPEAENKRTNGGKSRKGGRKGAGTPPPPPQQQQQSPAAQSAAQAPQQQGAQQQQQAAAAAGEDGRKKAGRKPWWARRDTKRDQHKARGGDGAQQQRAQTAVGA